MSFTRVLLSLSVALMLSACAGDPLKEPEPEEEFGSSVRNMVRVQQFNPLAGKAAQPPSGMDGQRAEAAMDGYRTGQPVIVPNSATGTPNRHVWTKTSESGEK
jgi:hypothetical protein